MHCLTARLEHGLKLLYIYQQEQRLGVHSNKAKSSSTSSNKSSIVWIKCQLARFLVSITWIGMIVSHRKRVVCKWSYGGTSRGDN